MCKTKSKVLTKMITSLKQHVKEKKSNFLKSNLNQYIVNKDQIIEYPKRIWFKGSRHR